VVDFYEYYEGLQEGWDGPALLVFSDGKKIGARLDRNGLRPARFWRTSDDTIYVASEVGVLGDVITNAENVVAKGRLGPGQMVCADLSDGSFSENAAISKAVATKQPYKEWLGNSLRRLEDISPSSFYSEPTMEAAQMLKLQAANGMGAEDAQMVVEGMAQSGVEPTYCMGDDIPLAVLSDKPHMLYDYFKQRFAQVGDWGYPAGCVCANIWGEVAVTVCAQVYGFQGGGGATRAVEPGLLRCLCRGRRCRAALLLLQQLLSSPYVLGMAASVQCA
jgi:glutamate synthase (ferredoxin)